MQDQGRCPWQCLPGRKSCWVRVAFFSGLQEDANVSTATETRARTKACDNTPQFCMQHFKPPQRAPSTQMSPILLSALPSRLLLLQNLSRSLQQICL